MPTTLPTIGAWLQQATQVLAAAHIQTARLDALVLAGHVLQQHKAWLLAHDDDALSSQNLARLNAMLKQRANRLPLAYITGTKEFFGRDLNVNPHVLIPRPETETLIELLAGLPTPDDARLIDVGTGSGAIAITAKLEHPSWTVWASDIDPKVLAIAAKNAATLGAAVQFAQADLLDVKPGQSDTPAAPKQSITPTIFDIIAANLPYVATNATVSPETAYEPQHALYAAQDGLALIYKLITQAPQYLAAHGYLLLEAEPNQHTAIISRAKDYNLELYSRHGFILALQASNRRSVSVSRG